MKERGIVVFSGISTRVIDRLTRQLNANGLDSAFVKIIEGRIDDDYFDRLLSQTLVVLERSRARGEITLRAVLVSGLREAERLEQERQRFFPALRRLSINPEWRNNPDAAPRVLHAVLQHCQSGAEKEFARAVSPKREARLLLPVSNSRCKAIPPAFLALYAMERDNLTPRVFKEAVGLRKRKAFRIGAVDFAPAINDGRHPIRRCSPTHHCDLGVAFRFGAQVAERMEFDVTCDRGLRGKTFHQCDGTRETLAVEPTHVNMRINGDFGVG